MGIEAEIWPLRAGPQSWDLGLFARFESRGEGGTHEKKDQSPKGNMWSAIPGSLLCMVVNLSGGKQGSGPEGDEVL